MASRVAATVIVDAIATQAIIEPQYDSKISEPMPAMSPTLSPTLSAITPGLCVASLGLVGLGGVYWYFGGDVGTAHAINGFGMGASVVPDQIY